MGMMYTIYLILILLRTFGPEAARFIRAIEGQITPEMKDAALRGQDEAVSGFKNWLNGEEKP